MPCMLSNRAQSALYNIRHNILAARRFTADITFEEFKQSDLHFYAVMRALEIVSSGRAVAGMAAEVRGLATPGTVLVHEGPIENSGALEFYGGRRPILVDAGRSVLGIGATFPDSAPVFWTSTALREAWLSGTPLILVTPRDPDHSVIATLPADRVTLLRAENGRWLYASVPRR